MTLEEDRMTLDTMWNHKLHKRLIQLSMLCDEFRVTTGPGKSRKVLEFRKTIFQAWKVMENSEGRGKLWKISTMSWILWNF